jgi:hypothetical protein
MHSAPAVIFPVGRSRFQGWLVGLTGSIAVSVGLLWCYQTDSVGWRHGLYLSIVIVTLVRAIRVLQRSPSGNLHWDGQTWRWCSAEVSVGGVLAAHLDFGFFLVLSLRPANGAKVWLWPERRVEVAHWNALRRTVFSRDAN